MQKNPLAKMNEQWLLVLGIYLCLFGYNLADNDGGCIIAQIPDSAWRSLYLISANDNSTTETVLFESEYTGPLNITSITPGEDNNKIDFTKYFKITAEDGKFIITATDEMQNFDSAVPKQPVNYIVGSIQLQIECANGISQLNLQTKVTDVNEHAPDLKKNYLFKVASPIMTLTDFTIYGSPIQATDLDFSNQNVAFTMDPDDFDITTVISEANSKTYIPVFKAKRVLLIGKQKSYTLTATDTGTIPGTKSSTSNVTLEANADSLETPIFNKHAFHFNYSTTNENYSLNIIDGPITLISTKLNITTLELSGDLAPEFDIDLDQTTGKITVTLNSELDTQLSVVTLTLVATTDNSAVVSLIVYMPQSSIQFSSHSYTGNYDLDTNTVSVKPDIEIVTFATTGTPEVTMIGNLSDHFSVVLDNKTNTYVINVVKNLTYTELKENLPLEYVLAISVEDKTDTASLVINAVLETIQFSQQIYTAVYNPDDDSVTSDISVSFIQDLSASSITIEGSYADNFKFVADTDKKNWNLQVITPLEGDVLKSETMIMLKIIAEDKNKQTAYAVVEITLPKGPKFTKSYYSATYTVNKDKLILFDEDPTFEGTVNPKDVTIELDSFKDNFEILYNDEWQIAIKNVLNDSVIANSDIRITLTATELKKTNIGTTVLILTIPAQEPPIFSSVFYNIDYPDSGTDIMYFKPDLTFTNIEDQNSVTISLDGDYSANFKAVYDNDEWQMKILSTLDTAVLVDNTEITLTLSATQNNNEHKGIAVLIVQLPSVKGPKFSKTHYKGQYIVNENTHTISLTESIVVTSVDDEVNITVDSYSENFEVQYNADNKEYKFVLISPLTQDILDSNVDLIIGVEATDFIGTVYATVVLNIDTGVAPEFSQIYYRADYDSASKELVLDNIIQINNQDDLKNIAIAIDESYISNFNLTYNSKTSSWDLTVTSPPSSDAVITITATSDSNDKTGTATLAFIKKIQEPDLPPVFSQPYYSAQYTIKPDNTSDIIKADPIEITNNNSSKITLTIEENYDKNFKFDLDTNNNQWNLKISTPLTDDILNNYTELILTLTAADKDTKTTGKSTLIITLPPHKVVENYLNFKEVHYTGQYKTFSKVVDLDNKIDITSNKNLSDVLISLTDNSDGLKYFNINHTADGYQIDVLTPVPDDVLKTTQSFIFTLLAEVDGLKGYATLVLNLPKIVEIPISFKEVLYYGNYDSKGGEISLNDTITFTTEEPIDNIDFFITSDFSEYFAWNISDKEISLTTKNTIPADVLKNNSTISLIISAEIKNTDFQAITVVNLAVTGLSPSDTIAFEDVLYNGKYTSEDNKLDVKPINIITDTTDEVQTSITDENGKKSEYFEAKCTNKVLTVSKLKDLPESVLAESTSLTLTLTVTIQGTSISASSVLNIKIVKPEEIIIQFDKILYTGEYTEDAGTGNLKIANISLIEKNVVESDINVYLEDDEGYSIYFNVSLENNTVTIILQEDIIPREVTENNPVITLALTAETGSDILATAIVNIKIINDDKNQETIKFDKVLYNGEYTVDNQKGNLSISDNITLLISDTNVQDRDINLSFADGNDFNQYFTITQAKEIVTVQLSKEALPDNVINDKYVITLTLNAEIISKKQTASAVLNINILKPEEVVVQFDQLLYTGEYTEAEGIGKLTFDDINLREENVADTDLTVTLKDDAGYSTYFKASLKNSVVAIKLAKDIIPEEVTENNPVITLTLTAEKDSDVLATAIVNIKIINSSANDTGTILFEKNIYNGELSVSRDGTQNLTISEVIKTITDSPDDEVVPTIIEVNGLNQYFKPGYKNKIFTVTLSEELPAAIISDKTIIALTLQTQIKNTSKIAISILNILIDKNKPNTGYINFSSSLYNGQYSVNDTAAQITHDDISLDTDQDESDIDVTVTNEYAKYFSAHYENKLVKITIEEPVPKDIYNTITVIPLVLTAQLSTESLITGTTIVNLLVNSDSKVTNDTLAFVDPLYTGKYEVDENNKGQLTIEKDIKIITNRPINDIKCSITNDQGYSKYFNASLSNTIFTVLLSENLPDEIVSNNTFIALTLEAELSSTKTAVTILNIQLSGKNPVDNDLRFSNTLYKGTYQVLNNKPSVKYDDMSVVTNYAADKIILTLTSTEYSDYFSVSLSDKIVILHTKDAIPKDMIKNMSYVALTLKAEIKNTTISASSVLTLQVAGNDNGKNVKSTNITPYVVFLIILSIVILVMIAAAVVFYYFRIRQKDYTDVDEEFWKVRFADNADKKMKKKSGSEVRRPTGFVFNHLEEEGDPTGESSVDPELERRKSVVFDENIEKMPIDSAIDESRKSS